METLQHRSKRKRFVVSALAALSISASLWSQAAAPSALSEHYHEAQAALTRGDHDAAAYQLRMFLTDALGEIAINDAHAGLYARAGSAFEQALGFAPHSTVLLLEYAQSALHAGDLDAARSLATRVTNGFPQNAKAHMLLGEVLLKQGKSADARKQFEEAVAANPTFAAGYDLAVACLNLGDGDCAAHTFDEMRLSFGESAPLELYIGQAYLNSDFQNRAVEAFRLATAKDPHLPGAHYSLAAADLVTGAGVEVAEKELRAEIALAPREAVAYAALGHLEEGQQRLPDAERDLERAIALAPDDPDAYLYLGQLRNEQKRPAEAVVALRRSIELTTDVSRNNNQVQRAHYLLGRLLSQTGDKAAAEKEFAISRSLLDGSLSTARDRLADYYEQPGDGTAAPSTAAASTGSSEVDPKAAKAAEALEKQLTPSIADSYNNLGAMAGGAGHYGEALADFRRAAEWEPKLPDLDENLGRAAYAAGQFADAVTPLTSYLASHPADDTLRVALGVSLSMTNQQAQAVQTLEPLVTAGKSSTQAVFVYAQALLATGRNQQALEQLRSLGAKLPGSAQVHRALGQAYDALHQPSKAQEELATATRLDPRDARAWAALGRVELEQGQSGAAIASLQSAAQLDPSDADMHRVLAAAYRVAGRPDDAARESARSQALTAPPAH